jgi:hypothetical protein
MKKLLSKDSATLARNEKYKIGELSNFGFSKKTL